MCSRVLQLLQYCIDVLNYVPGVWDSHNCGETLWNHIPDRFLGAIRHSLMVAYHNGGYPSLCIGYISFWMGIAIRIQHATSPCQKWTPILSLQNILARLCCPISSICQSRLPKRTYSQASLQYITVTYFLTWKCNSVTKKKLLVIIDILFSFSDLCPLWYFTI